MNATEIGQCNSSIGLQRRKLFSLFLFFFFFNWKKLINQQREQPKQLKFKIKTKFDFNKNWKNKKKRWLTWPTARQGVLKFGGDHAKQRYN